VSALLHDGATEIDAYKDMLGQLWLYVDWRYVTKQLETEHKERWAQAVEAWSRALNPGDPDPIHVDRWWLCPTCGVSIRAKLEDGPHTHCVLADDARGTGAPPIPPPLKLGEQPREGIDY
jgi:hypothetical protein